MAKARTLVGLDVHAAKIVAAVLDAETGEVQWLRVSGDVGEAAGLCAALPRPVRAAYEAGPTGYGLARELARRGVDCVVAAPSKIPRASGERVKTDRRDAEHLVRLLLAGKLHPVRVPGPEEEALRDLVRAREAVRVDLMRCRHRLSKLLLRRGIRFDEGRAWTERHRAWLGALDLGHGAAQATLADAVGAVDALCHRRDQLERAIVTRLEDSPWATQVGRLRCLRGIDTLTAAGLCAEIGDFERFARAEQLMNYVGLVPSENTTGQQRRLGAITKTGSGHARRLLVEAACKTATTASPPWRSRSPGAPSSACTAPGNGSSNAPSAAPSSPSPPPVNSPASAGRSPPAPNNSLYHHTPSAGPVAARHARGEPARQL
jgi:transposase